MTAYKFEYEGSTYKMEFDRASIKLAEKMFNLTLSDFLSGNEAKLPSLTTMEALFHASLLKHHPQIKESTVSTLYELQSDKTELYQQLLEMYVEVIQPLMIGGPAKNGLKREKI